MGLCLCNSISIDIKENESINDLEVIDKNENSDLSLYFQNISKSNLIIEESKHSPTISGFGFDKKINIIDQFIEENL